MSGPTGPHPFRVLDPAGAVSGAALPRGAHPAPAHSGSPHPRRGPAARGCHAGSVGEARRSLQPMGRREQAAQARVRAGGRARKGRPASRHDGRSGQQSRSGHDDPRPRRRSRHDPRAGGAAGHRWREANPVARCGVGSRARLGREPRRCGGADVARARALHGARRTSSSRRNGRLVSARESGLRLGCTRAGRAGARRKLSGSRRDLRAHRHGRHPRGAGRGSRSDGAPDAGGGRAGHGHPGTFGTAAAQRRAPAPGLAREARPRRSEAPARARGLRGRHPPARTRLRCAHSGELPHAPVLFWNTYNSVDLAAGTPRPIDPALLPPRFRRVLEAPEVS